MRKLSELVVRGRIPILILALVGLVVAGAVGGGVADRLSSGGFEDPAAESVIASEVLVDNFGVRSPDLVFVDITAEYATFIDGTFTGHRWYR